MKKGLDNRGKVSGKKEMNHWKLSFFSLLAILLLSVSIIGIKLTTASKGTDLPPTEYVKPDGQKALSVKSTKEEMNTIINYYLETYQKSSNVAYHFVLKNQAVLQGEVTIFKIPVKYYLYFDPYVMDNGNIQLRAKSISIGSLGVPIKEVLKLVKASYQLPEYVEVQPADKMIVVRLDQLTLKNGMSVKADKIDLIDDEIEASLYLPKTDTKTEE